MPIIGAPSSGYMRVYEGHRTDEGCRVYVNRSGSKYPLDPRLDLFSHSPDGFEWGYSSSGSAQLALALLADVLADDILAVQLHQEFKRLFVADLPRDRAEWSIRESVIRSYARLIIKHRVHELSQ